jgi:hypothetical protein
MSTAGRDSLPLELSRKHDVERNRNGHKHGNQADKRKLQGSPLRQQRLPRYQCQRSCCQSLASGMIVSVVMGLREISHAHTRCAWE